MQAIRSEINRHPPVQWIVAIGTLALSVTSLSLILTVSNILPTSGWIIINYALISIIALTTNCLINHWTTYSMILKGLKGIVVIVAMTAVILITLYIDDPFTSTCPTCPECKSDTTQCPACAADASKVAAIKAAVAAVDVAAGNIMVTAQTTSDGNIVSITKNLNTLIGDKTNLAAKLAALNKILS